MAELTRDQLKTLFETGDKPTQEHFWNLLDSVLIKNQDTGLPPGPGTVTFAMLASSMLTSTLGDGDTSKLATAASTKAYVDALVSQAISGVKYKDSARAVVVDRAGPLAPLMSGTYTTLDGVALQVGDRVVVNSTLNATLNGIYVVASGTWQRATDADTGSELRGATLLVEEGTNFGDKILITTNNGPITIGSTSITWAVIGQAISYTAGNGLVLSGNQFSVGSNVQLRSVTPAAIVSGALDMDQPRRSFTTVSGTAQTLNLSSLTNAAAGKDVFIRYTSTNAADALTVAMAGVTVRTQGVFVPTVINDIIIEAISATELVVLINPVF